MRRTAAAVLVLTLVGMVMIGRNYRSWAYCEHDQELHIRHGALFRRLVVVPYGRMQYVDVTAGPIEQLFKVSSTQLHTAAPGTSARIVGLAPAEAARLRDRLTELGTTQQPPKHTTAARSGHSSSALFRSGLRDLPTISSEGAEPGKAACQVRPPSDAPA